MTEERSKRREFLPLVFIVNCYKIVVLIRRLTSLFPFKSPLFYCSATERRECSTKMTVLKRETRTRNKT